MTEREEATGSAREEAERLVAAALAAASEAARGLVRGAAPLSNVADLAERLLAGGSAGHVATGSAECCVCPVCRAIAALRDPSPQLALKVATGASDLASGVAGVLRTVGGMVSRPPVQRAGNPPDAGSHRPRTAADPDVTWRLATTAPAATADTTATADSAATAGRATDAAPVDEGPAGPGWVEPDDPWHAATTAPVPSTTSTPVPPEHPAPADGD